MVTVERLELFWTYFIQRSVEPVIRYGSCSKIPSGLVKFSQTKCHAMKWYSVDVWSSEGIASRVLNFGEGKR